MSRHGRPLELVVSRAIVEKSIGIAENARPTSLPALITCPGADNSRSNFGLGMAGVGGRETEVIKRDLKWKCYPAGKWLSARYRMRVSM